MNNSPIAAIPVPNSSGVQTAETFLSGKHNTLACFASLEDLVLSEDNIPPSELNGIKYHISRLRIEIASALWQNEIFVSSSLLDEFIFQTARRNTKGICSRILNELAQTSVHESGFIVFPLHSFGIQIDNLFAATNSNNSEVIFRDVGIGICPQANSSNTAYQRIKRITKRLGVAACFSQDDFSNLTAPDRLRWVRNNPLMIVRIASHTGSMYENQFIYMMKLKTAGAYITMLHALITVSSTNSRILSTSYVNNFETLDISHYLVGEATSGANGAANARRVPMNVEALELARLADLAVTLHEDTLKLSKSKRCLAQLRDGFKSFEKNYLKYVHLENNKSAHRRFYARTMTALDWYRRSFGFRSTDNEAIVYLAVAFETLLTDGYASKPNERIERRVKICLKHQRGVGVLAQAVTTVMSARGAIVHNGTTMQTADLRKAQVAFAKCFLKVVKLAKSLSPTEPQPMSQMLNDS